MTSRAIELVIFDCDGVLVDSERLSAEVLTALMAEAGIDITPKQFREDFLGRSFPAAAALCENRTGKRLPRGFQQLYRKRLLERMQEELAPMPGVGAVLAGMTAPYCLATSSSPERLETSLRATGLAGYFANRRFTASEVEKGKPAPDLFLHAAHRMGGRPETSLVIEDSEMGILAARAAGMEVWQFTGGGHVTDGYALPGGLRADAVMPDMAALHEALSRLGLCASPRNKSMNNTNAGVK
jgi:HAD superfamily hydrolase (TIGR01509 family)